MERKWSIRIPALALAATLALAAPAAAAPWADSPAGFGWLAQAWQRLVGLWEGGLSNSVWGEEGGAMDPDGRPGLVSIWGEEGSAMDPNGRSAPQPGPLSVWGEEGSEMDPNGRLPVPQQ
jgi:hypothetical protein